MIFNDAFALDMQMPTRGQANMVFGKTLSSRKFMLYSGAKDVDLTFHDEFDMWQQMRLLLPDEYQSLKSNVSLPYRMLAHRGELMLTRDFRELDSIRLSYAETLLKMFDVVLTTLNAVNVSRADLSVRRQAYASLIAYSHVITNVRLPGSNAKSRLDVSVLPCPYRSNAFDIRVKVGSESDEMAIYAQQRVQQALFQLREMGYIIEDVAAGLDFTPSL